MSILWASLLAFIVSLVITKPTISLSKRIGLVDDPKKRSHPAHIHEGIIPRAGGIPLYLGLLIPSLLFITISKIVIGILIVGALIIIVGILDDFYDISPYIRFFLNIILVSIVIFFGLGIPYVSNSFFGGVVQLDSFTFTFDLFWTHTFLVWSNIVSIIWIVALMNFVNWSKGVDGQMPGFVLIAALFLGSLSFRIPAHHITKESIILLSFITAGSFGGFLVWNVYPQKIMPGYGGGSLAGFMLGVLSILSFGKIGIVILILSIPLIDACYVIIRRLKNRTSPFRGDALHFHHRLLQMGWGKMRIALFYWIITFLFGLSSFFLYGIQKVLALIMVAGALAFFIIISERIKKEKNIKQT